MLKETLNEVLTCFEAVMAVTPEPATGTLARRLIELARAQFFDFDEDRQEALEVVCNAFIKNPQAERHTVALAVLADAVRVSRKKEGRYRKQSTHLSSCGDDLRLREGRYPLNGDELKRGMENRMKKAKRLVPEAFAAPTAPDTLVCSHAGHARYAAA